MSCQVTFHYDSRVSFLLLWGIRVWKLLEKEKGAGIAVLCYTVVFCWAGVVIAFYYYD
jgi:hypothetical protein